VSDADAIAGLTLTIARVEAKVDRLSDKVDSGDRASEQLVELVKVQLVHVQEGLNGIRDQLTAQADRSRVDTNQVRIDLERQLKDRTDEGTRIHESIVGDLKETKDSQKAAASALYARVDRLDAITNRLMGGLALASALGLSGLVALVRGLS
jgi:uncharacterized protein YPO0396